MMDGCSSSTDAATMKHERCPQHIAAVYHGNHLIQSNKSQHQRVVVAGYTIETKIGSGSFATVYRGRKTISPPQHGGINMHQNQHQTLSGMNGHHLAAIKAMSIDEHKLTKNVLRSLNSEIRSLREVNCENIVELYDVVKTDSHIFLELEVVVCSV